jgi:hypothetical protein
MIQYYGLVVACDCGFANGHVLIGVNDRYALIGVDVLRTG